MKFFAYIVAVAASALLLLGPGVKGTISSDWLLSLPNHPQVQHQVVQQVVQQLHQPQTQPLPSKWASLDRFTTFCHGNHVIVASADSFWWR